VRTLYEQARKKPGEVDLAWDSRNGRGKVVGPGRYWIRVHAQNRIGGVDLTGAVLVRRL
jgi:hypothetical protein